MGNEGSEANFVLIHYTLGTQIVRNIHFQFFQSHNNTLAYFLVILGAQNRPVSNLKSKMPSLILLKSLRSTKLSGLPTYGGKVLKFL